MRKLAFLLGMWLVSLAMADKRAHPSRKANDTKNRVTADYSAHWTAINSNTKTRTAINTGAGGTTRENFLGTLTQMSTLGTPSGSASHSGVGTISGGSGPTDSEFNDLNTAYNNAADFINGVATDLASLINELRTANLMN